MAAKALGIPEILGVIFEHCFVDSRSLLQEWLEPLDENSSLSSLPGHATMRLNRLTLVSAATTCRRFTSPALRVLWRTIDSIHPLIALFPVVLLAGQYVLAPEVSPDTWSRFDFYRNLVRAMVVRRPPPQPTPMIPWNHDHIWTIILTKVNIPLPHLHTLVIPTFGSFLSLNSLAPFPRSLEFRSLMVGEISDSPLFTLFCSLMHHTSLFPVHSLIIDTDIMQTDLALIASPSLRILQVKIITTGTNHPVSMNFASLERLDLRLAGDASSLPQPPNLLPSLRSLRLSGRVNLISTFLSSCHCGLESVFVKLDPPLNSNPDAGENAVLSFHTVFFGIIGEKWAHTLKHLELDFGSPPLNTGQKCNMAKSVQLIANIPFLTFHLRNFPWSLNPPFITWTLSKFSYAQSLSLHRKIGNGLTLSQLSEVAVSCPDLYHLGVSLQPDEETPQLPVLQHTLKVLNVFNSRIAGTPDEIALNLDRMFPSLVKIENSASGKHATHWKEVERLLLFLRRARCR